MQPRSAGTLQIGSVIYDKRTEVFSVEMLFEGNGQFSPEDEMKSGATWAARHFQQLLRQNGFHDHGPPETVTKPTGPGRFLIYIACKAKRSKPAIIMLKEPPHGDALTGLKHNGNKKKANGDEGGDPQSDEA